ncbi:MAG: cyclic pyranopterin monophosphate synthase MoaC [Acidimicrobiales bacterium]
MTKRPFTHVTASGKLRMVDISNKRPTRRKALARCLVVTTTALTTLESRDDELDALHAARVAGVFAAKRTADVIPLCHSLNLSDVDVELREREGGVEISATVSATQATGVEMEALTACAFAALSLLDALKDADPHARIDDLVLLKKEGGKSGDWGRLVEGADEGASTRRSKRRDAT